MEAYSWTKSDNKKKERLFVVYSKILPDEVKKVSNFLIEIPDFHQIGAMVCTVENKIVVIILMSENSWSFLDRRLTLSPKMGHGMSSWNKVGRQNPWFS